MSCDADSESSSFSGPLNDSNKADASSKEAPPLEMFADDDVVRAWEVPDHDDGFYCMFCRDTGLWTPRCPYVGVWTACTNATSSTPSVGTLVAVVPSEDASVCTVVDLAISAGMVDHEARPRDAAAAVTRWHTNQLAPLLRRRSSAPCLGRESRQVASWVGSMCVKLCRAHLYDAN